MHWGRMKMSKKRDYKREYATYQGTGNTKVESASKNRSFKRSSTSKLVSERSTRERKKK